MSRQREQPETGSEPLLYRTSDARTRVEVRLQGDSVWLTQAQMAALYQVSAKTISEHLGNVLDEGECEPERTIRKFRIVRIEGGREVRPMTMADWIAKLDDFLRLGERDILTHAGSVNHAAALQHAERAFDLYRQRQDKALTAVDRDFDAATRTLQRIANSTRKPAAKKKDTDT